MYEVGLLQFISATSLYAALFFIERTKRIECALKPVRHLCIIDLYDSYGRKYAKTLQ